MNSFRFALAVVSGLCCLRPVPLPADDSAAPFTMDKHYSADLVVTMKGGMVVSSKAYIDGDKMRSDVNMGGMAMEIIVRKDTKKMYRVLEAQKMVMVSDFNPGGAMGNAAASFGPEGKFELIGPETIDGVACTKYKVTSDKTKQVFFFWLDTVHKVPLETAAPDGSLLVKWKNFNSGPQDPSLFEPPADYQVIEAPAMPGEMPDAPAGP